MVANRRSERTAASVYHVRKEDLREGSALDVDPPFPAFDVVHRQAYERLAEDCREARMKSAAKPLLCRAGFHGHLEVLRSMLWFDLVRCIGCGKRGYRVRRG